MRGAICLILGLSLVGCGKKETVSYDRPRPAAKPKLVQMIESAPQAELTAIKDSPSVQSAAGEPLAVEGEIVFASTDEIGPILVDVSYKANVGEVSAQSGIGQPVEVEGLRWRYRVELNAPIQSKSYDVKVKCLERYVAKCKLVVK